MSEQFRAVVSDLDGTLLNSEHLLSPVTREVFCTLADKGHDMILASGRAYVDMAALRQELGLDMYLIASNGAQIFCPQGEMIYQQAIEPSVVQAALSLARQFPAVHLNAYQNTCWVVEQENPSLLAYHTGSGFSYQVRDLSAEPVDNLTGFIKLFFIADHAELVPLEQQLRAQFGEQLAITYSLPNCLEVMSQGVNKGQALHRVLSLLGHQPEQAIAFGDGMNDVEMLSLVGRGLVMGNAPATVRAALPASEVIDSHCQDGVARYLQQHLLS